jgi:methionyl-tRNA formyltransferase
VPTLARLLAGTDEVAAVVTQPDRRRGRGRKNSPSPVAECALAARVPVLRPERVGDAACVDALRALEPDLGVVVAFGQFLPKKIRELPRLGHLVNGHASILPRHRGAAPIAHAILAGDSESGVSVMRVEREMDAGPVCLVKRTPIGPDETAGELEERLARIAADAISEALPEIATGRAHWTEQDAGAATFAPKLAPEDGRLDFRQPAAELARRVRGLTPRPGTFVVLGGGERLRILRAEAADASPGDPPGTVRIHAEELRVATGAGWLVVRVLQKPGGRPLPTGAFLRGNPIADGTYLETAT